MTTRHVLTINPAAPTASDINEIHKLVMAGYSHAITDAAAPRAALNILFHVQPTKIDKQHYPLRATRITKVLVQADIPGDWTNTPYVVDPILNLTVGPAIDTTHNYATGDTIDINTFLNATHSQPSPPRADPNKRRKRGKRHSTVNAKDVATWAAKIFSNNGLQLHPETITVHKPHRYLGNKPHRQIIIDTRHITATGTITDYTAITTALTTGIGRGRPYGAGLIRHRPTPAN